LKPLAPTSSTDLAPKTDDAEQSPLCGVGASRVGRQQETEFLADLTSNPRNDHGQEEATQEDISRQQTSRRNSESWGAIRAA
jgi:hypothetical protein